MIKSLLVSFGLVLVLEGIMPFAAPASWRRNALLLAAQKDRFLRRLGLILMIVGAAVIIVVQHLL